MQKRAESAETENEKLKKEIKIMKSKPHQDSFGSQFQQDDWHSIHEKTNYIVGHMSKISLESEKNIRGLLSMSKEFHVLMDMLQSLDNVTNVYEEKSSEK